MQLSEDVLEACATVKKARSKKAKEAAEKRLADKLDSQFRRHFDKDRLLDEIAVLIEDYRAACKEYPQSKVPIPEDVVPLISIKDFRFGRGNPDARRNEFRRAIAAAAKQEIEA